jgi:hypothetical protein
MIHGFLLLSELFDEGRQAMEEAILWLRHLFDRQALEPAPGGTRWGS